MKVKVKKLHPDAVIPSYAKPSDAGLDLTAVARTDAADLPKGVVEYLTGLAIEIPKGHVGLIFPRSSVSLKNLDLTNSVGVVDAGYRGEIKCRFRMTPGDPLTYRVGDRVAQLIILPYPSIELVEADTLSDTERGKGGFGSTDDKSEPKKDEKKPEKKAEKKEEPPKPKAKA